MLGQRLSGHHHVFVLFFKEVYLRLVEAHLSERVALSDSESSLFSRYGLLVRVAL